MVGVRWRMHGRTMSGVDCAGLPVLVLSKIGINIKDNLGYDARMPCPTMLRNVIDSFATPARELGPGRIAVCGWGNGSTTRHVALCVEDKHIIHCDVHNRRVVKVPASWLDGRLTGIFTIDDIDYSGVQPW